MQHKQTNKASQPARPPMKMYFLVQYLNANSTTGIRDLLLKGVKSEKIAFLHSFHKSPKAKNCLQTTQLDLCPTTVVYNKLCQTTDTEGKVQKLKGVKEEEKKKKREWERKSPSVRLAHNQLELRVRPERYQLCYLYKFFVPDPIPSHMLVRLDNTVVVRYIHYQGKTKPSALHKKLFRWNHKR